MQITKIVTFDTGHRLSSYEGKCKSLHGHTYKLEVTVEGKTDLRGMVIDFGDLKQILKDQVDNKFDHKMVLFKNDPVNKKIANGIPRGENWIVWVDYNPTAENMARDIYSSLRVHMKPLGVRLARVKLWETLTSFAEVLGD